MAFVRFIICYGLFCLLSAEPARNQQISAVKPLCNYSTVWVDMIFVFDTSSAMGDISLETAWTYAASTLSEFNLQYPNYTASNYSTRLGIVTYGDYAKVYRELGTLNNQDVTKISSLPYNGDENTNLEDALRLAMEQVEGPNHRPNAQRIIVIMAATYRSRGQQSPQLIADNFKESRGIIIVYNIFKMGADIQILKEIASPGYFLSVKDASQHELSDALCDANCFCPPPSSSFLNNGRDMPISGCYNIVDMAQNFNRAALQCSRVYNGIIATDKTANKTMFLTSLIPNTTIYIGLQWNDASQNWMWMDGTPLGDYNLWEGGIAPRGSSVTNVFLSPSLSWIITDGRNGYDFCCESLPCSADYYCPPK